MVRFGTIDAEFVGYLECFVEFAIGDGLELDTMFRRVRRGLFRANGIAFAR